MGCVSQTNKITTPKNNMNLTFDSLYVQKDDSK